MELQYKYTDIHDDYHYKLGYNDAKKEYGFLLLISFTAGFIIAYGINLYLKDHIHQN